MIVRDLLFLFWLVRKQELLKVRKAAPGSNSQLQQQQQQQAVLRRGEGGGTVNNSASASSNSNNKRYIILTYAAEYDRVHYPLPLAFVESPSSAQPGRTGDRPREVMLCAL